MSVMTEVIEAAFSDEYARLKHDGFDTLVEKRLDELLYMAYRRGYIRGDAARSRAVQQQEEMDHREGRFPMNVDIRYEGDRLILDGRDRTPVRGGAAVHHKHGSINYRHHPRPRCIA